MSIPFICIGISFLLIYLSKIPLGIAMNQLPGGYDNKHPRSQQAQLEGWGHRAYAAHQNCYETFAPFAIAIMLNHFFDVDSQWVQSFSLIFVISRVFYIVFYLLNWDLLRSSVWFVGFLSNVGLYILPFSSGVIN